MATIDDKYCNRGSIEDMVSVFYNPDYSESGDISYVGDRSVTISIADWGDGPNAAMNAGWASYVAMIGYLNEAYPNMNLNPCEFNGIQVIVWSICQICSAMDNNIGVGEEISDPIVECATKLRKAIVVNRDDDEPNPA